MTMEFGSSKESNEEQYKKNFTEEERAGHLSEEKAHDIANMMRSQIGIDPSDTGKKKLFFKDQEGNYRGLVNNEKYIYRYEYERALLNIEELEKLANDQTKAKEVMHKIGEIILGGGQIVVGALAGMGIAIAGSPKEYNQMMDSFKKAREESKFADSKKILKELMERGEDFAEIEVRDANN